jgi:hypothetical protein
LVADVLAADAELDALVAWVVAVVALPEALVADDAAAFWELKAPAALVAADAAWLVAVVAELQAAIE